MPGIQINYNKLSKSEVDIKLIQKAIDNIDNILKNKKIKYENKLNKSKTCVLQ